MKRSMFVVLLLAVGLAIPQGAIGVGQEEI